MEAPAQTAGLIELRIDYEPSKEAWAFHVHPARFKFLIWGIKGGKTLAGAREFWRQVMGSRRNSLSWVVAPTYSHLQEAERELLKVLYGQDGIILSRHRGNREIHLPGERTIQFKSADWPDNLRGPNIDGVIWNDEAGFMKEEAHYITRERVAATQASIIYTTTPRGRNWVWNEVQAGGMPADAPYGTFQKFTDDGGYFISHYPTWHFPWVPDHEIEAMRAKMPKVTFDQELGAMFMTDSNRVFHRVEERFNLEPPIKPKNLKERPVIGADLARHQDWTALIVMNGNGRILDIDRWNDTAWSVQRERIIKMCKKWNGATLILDKANVGSVIEEDMRDAGLDVVTVEMNSPQVKRSLIEQLQMAFERGSISIPDPRVKWAPDEALQLYNEVCWYECSTTAGGHLSYNAPRGLTDDLVVALGLANHGRALGLAGGASEAADLALSEDEWNKLLDEGDDEDENDKELLELEREIGRGLQVRRPDIFKNIFGNHKTVVGFESPSEPFWRRKWL